LVGILAKSIVFTVTTSGTSLPQQMHRGTDPSSRCALVALLNLGTFDLRLRGANLGGNLMLPRFALGDHIVDVGEALQGVLGELPEANQLHRNSDQQSDYDRESGVYERHGGFPRSVVRTLI
jgi:hypothetical protein